jgi:hypothetical protein
MAVEPVAPQPVAVKSKMPTKKWWVTQITALSALAIMFVTTGSWDQEETISAIGIVSQAVLSYFKENDPTPGGVPLEA